MFSSDRLSSTGACGALGRLELFIVVGNGERSCNAVSGRPSAGDLLVISPSIGIGLDNVPFSVVVEAGGEPVLAFPVGLCRYLHDRPG